MCGMKRLVHSLLEQKPSSPGWHVVLAAAFQQEGPVLVTIQTDPNALAMPPKLEFDQMKGMALYMEKMMLGGRMDEVFNIISSNYKYLSEVI
jgi:pyruvate dehydrogenase (quinone)